MPMKYRSLPVTLAEIAQAVAEAPRRHQWAEGATIREMGRGIVLCESATCQRCGRQYWYDGKKDRVRDEHCRGALV